MISKGILWHFPPAVASTPANGGDRGSLISSHHASIHNHFNHDRHFNRRDIFKQNRSAALAEWRQLAA
jgi:hypothetical protein